MARYGNIPIPSRRKDDSSKSENSFERTHIVKELFGEGPLNAALLECSRNLEFTSTFEVLKSANVEGLSRIIKMMKDDKENASSHYAVAKLAAFFTERGEKVSLEVKYDAASPPTDLVLHKEFGDIFIEVRLVKEKDAIVNFDSIAEDFSKKIEEYIHENFEAFPYGLLIEYDTPFSAEDFDRLDQYIFEELNKTELKNLNKRIFYYSDQDARHTARVMFDKKMQNGKVRGRQGSGWETDNAARIKYTLLEKLEKWQFPADNCIKALIFLLDCGPPFAVSDLMDAMLGKEVIVFNSETDGHKVARRSNGVIHERKFSKKIMNDLAFIAGFEFSDFSKGRVFSENNILTENQINDLLLEKDMLKTGSINQ